MSANESQTPARYGGGGSGGHVFGYRREVNGQGPLMRSTATFITFKEPEPYWWVRTTPLNIGVLYIPVDIVRVIEYRHLVDGALRFNQERRIIIQPDEDWPDVDGPEGWNAKSPPKEWVPNKFKGNKLEGPWRRFSQIHMIQDTPQMEKYIWAADHTTIGSEKAVDEIVDRMQMKGPNFRPVCFLQHAFMPTQFGGRERPYLYIHAWKAWGPSGPALPPSLPAQAALPAPSRVEVQASPAQERQFIPAREADAARDAARQGQEPNPLDRFGPDPFGGLGPYRSPGQAAPAPQRSLRDELNDEIPESLR
jgi:hypothetical protein